MLIVNYISILYYYVILLYHILIFELGVSFNKYNIHIYYIFIEILYKKLNYKFKSILTICKIFLQELLCNLNFEIYLFIEYFSQTIIKNILLNI